MSKPRLPKYSVGGSRTRKLRVPLETVAALVTRLNLWQRPTSRTRSGWTMGRVKAAGVEDPVREIVSMLEAELPLGSGSSLSRQLVKRFNRLAEEAPVTLQILEMELPKWGAKGARRHTQPTIGVSENPMAGLLLTPLWWALQTPALNRLRRCPQCSKWFVDRTRNRSAKRCSKRCTWAWWNRPRRRRMMIGGKAR